MTSDQEPGPTHSPYGQDPYGPPPSGQSPYGQQPTYGQQPAPYGQQPYGQGYAQAYGQQPSGDRRPGTVTAAAWITIVFSGLSAALLGLIALVFVVARDEFIAGFEDEWARSGAGADVDIDPESLAGVIVAMFVFLAIWALIAVVLGIFVLRRSNVARILLVISSSVVALFSLIGIASGISVVTLGAAVGVIVLLFVGGAGDWFKGVGHSATPAQYGQPYPGAGQQGYGGTSSPSPYGQDTTYGQQPNPYGQQPPADSSGDSGSDYPPKDYPGR